MGLVKHIFMPELLPEHRSRYILITKAKSIPEQIKIVGGTYDLEMRLFFLDAL